MSTANTKVKTNAREAYSDRGTEVLTQAIPEGVIGFTTLHREGRQAYATVFLGDAGKLTVLPVTETLNLEAPRFCLLNSNITKEFTAQEVYALVDLLQQ